MPHARNPNQGIFVAFKALQPPIHLKRLGDGTVTTVNGQAVQIVAHQETSVMELQEIDALRMIDALRHFNRCSLVHIANKHLLRD